MKFAAAFLPAMLALLSACTSLPSRRPAARGFWIDLVRGEEVVETEVLGDLATAGVVYVGEAHTVARHHAVQLYLLQQLFGRGVPLVLCLEQLEARDQPAVDRYNRREIDFAALAHTINWAQKWHNYPAYEPLCEFARQHGIPVHGLNAPAEVIRAVNRGGGLARLPAAQRAALPPDIVTDDPAYERLLQLELSVHRVATDAAKLRAMFEAQVARDETMAAQIVAARSSYGGATRHAFVVLGAGHMRYGLGTAARVRRRAPDTVERLVLITASGELQLSAADQAASRPIELSHADLRALARAPGDYLHVLPQPTAPALPPGHPPLAQ